MDNQTLVLPFTHIASFEDVGLALGEVLKIDPEHTRLRLHYRGRLVVKVKRSLAEEGVLDQSTLLVKHTLRGGMQVHHPCHISCYPVSAKHPPRASSILSLI